MNAQDSLPETLLTELGKVEVHFDWRPAAENGCVIFAADLIRGKERSAIKFEINLLKLTDAQLTRLHIFLERRQAGLTTHGEMARILCCLLDCSLTQAQPGSDKSLRDSKVRELLLYGQAR